MSRKRHREARARAWERIIERSKTDPVGLETELRRYQFIKSGILVIIAFWMFQEALISTFGKDFTQQLALISEHPKLSTLIALLAGIFLFIFREKQKFYYGLVEVSFSVALTYALLLHLETTGLGGLLAVGGAIYVTVRGLDNMRTGYKSPNLHHKENPKPSSVEIS
ncbi:hypothetical protein [Pseudomonas promysalinigenes]|uniref:hypothetical protein n=1 Tax=Pseudomonas promysalinigenes TaxID=485898 RepID=UPI00164668DB|nr:hypothetical protein [Pseudomonas promysalinigenes]QXI32139.1 hypothetical protein HU725_013890 [Pseudomonas promysalinigenes]